MWEVTEVKCFQKNFIFQKSGCVCKMLHWYNQEIIVHNFLIVMTLKNQTDFGLFDYWDGCCIISSVCSFIMRRRLDVQQGGVHKLRWQDEVNRWYWKYQLNANFVYMTVKEFYHKCQLGVGRWSKIAKILSVNVVKECPLVVEVVCTTRWKLDVVICCNKNGVIISAHEKKWERTILLKWFSSLVAIYFSISTTLLLGGHHIRTSYKRNYSSQQMCLLIHV